LYAPPIENTIGKTTAILITVSGKLDLIPKYPHK
jgi:hypothetical protein